MPTNNSPCILPWLLDHRTCADDIVPLRVDLTNWFSADGEPFSAEITVHYYGYDEVTAELVIRPVANGYLVDVVGERVLDQWHSVPFGTFHAAQLAAEQHALHVCHLIPVEA